MKKLILLILLIFIATRYARSAEFSVHLKCTIGHTDIVYYINSPIGETRFTTSFKDSNSNNITVVVEDVNNPNPADDYVITTDGKHTFTQPMYCSKR